MLLEYKMPLRKTNTTTNLWEGQQCHIHFTTLSGQTTWELKKTSHRIHKGSLESRALGKAAPYPGVLDFVLQQDGVNVFFPTFSDLELSQGSGIDYFLQAAVGKWFLTSHL